MADITAEIPTVEEVLTRAAATSDVSTIVSEALERRSSNSSVAAFSPFIVADVKNVNDVPEVTMTESIYNSLRTAQTTLVTEIPAPVEVTTVAPLPDSAESSVDGSNADATVGTSDRDDISESNSVAVSENDGINSEHSDDEKATELEDASESDEEKEEENTIHSDEETEKLIPQAAPHAEQNPEAQIPIEILFLLMTVLLLNFFNFLLTLTGARQCVRPY